MSAKYACIAAHRAQYPVPLMCRVLAVSRSGYYASRTRAPSARARRDAVLQAQIRVVHTASRRTYGAPRIQQALQQAGARVGRKRVARLMRTAHLQGLTPRRWRVQAGSERTAATPNRLARAFAPTTALDRVWVADITYLPYRGGTAYLAVVLDLASRAVIGWAVDAHLLTTLPLDALEQALLSRRPRPGTLHHSDRGSQYQSAAYQARLADRGLVPSLSASGNCYDNAVVESFFNTLKRECDTTERASLREIRSALFDYLEIWYNRQRLHSSLGYRAPATYEAQLPHNDRAA